MADTVGTERIRGYDEQYYGKMFESLWYMDGFLEKETLSNLLKKIENRICLISIKEMESESKSLSTKKISGPSGFIMGFYQSFKEDINLIFAILFQ